MQFIRKYGTAAKVRIPIVKAGSSDFAVGADWTPAAGDVKISKNGGAAANITTLPTAIAMGNGAIWEFSISATEMQAAEITITVVDSATKAVQDQAISIITFGNASAGIVLDMSISQTGDSYAALTGAQSEPGQGTPAANASPLVKLSYVYKFAINPSDHDGSVIQHYNNAGAVVDQKRTFTKAGSVVTIGQMSTGP